MTSQEISHSGGTETSRQARRHRRGWARRTTVLAVGLVSALAIGTLGGAGNAASVPPAAKGRVDLYTPTFANPLNITNPLFPKGPGKISQTIQLGDEPDTKLRFEATQLDQIRTVRWNGQNIKTRVTHEQVTPPVRRSVRIPEAYSRQVPLTVHAPREPVTEDYRTVLVHLTSRGTLP